MTREEWDESLEAWLDGELDVQAAAEFQQATEADVERRRLLEERLRLRASFRQALGEEVELPLPGRSAPRLIRRLWWTAGLAAAAMLALVALRRSPAPVEELRLPPMPHTAGLVAAPRLGEQSGRVHVLLPGRLELPAGSF